MGLDLPAGALAPWVASYVEASHALSGLMRPVRPAEVAAHRGFLARRRVGPANVAMLQFHLSDRCHDERAPLREPAAAELAALLDAPLTPWQLYVAFREWSPFGEGDARCARALWLSRRLTEGFRPDLEAGRLEWTETFGSYAANGEPAAGRLAAPGASLS